MLSHLIQDLRYGARALRARPGFTIAAILTLALGIGANAAIFSLLAGPLLRPLPYADDGRLVVVYNSESKLGLDNDGTSIPDYLDRRTQAAALVDLALYEPANFNLSLSGSAERMRALRATPSLFSTLGVAAQLGRVFGEDDAVSGREHVVVLSHGTWRNRFAADPDIVGRELSMNNQTYRIVGVMPAEFFFPSSDVQMWVPYAIQAAEASEDERTHSHAESIGRLRAGVSIAVLEAQMASIIQANSERSASLRSTYEASGFVGHARSLREEWFGRLKPALWLLQGVAFFVLLIACANVANLMLVRFSARAKELAMRAALGAGRARIVKQVLVECGLLAGIASVVGIGFAIGVLRLIGQTRFMNGWHGAAPTIDLPVVCLVVVLTLAVGIVLGLLPLISLRKTAALELLRSSGRVGAARDSGRIRNALVIAQIGLAVVLLVGAGLLLRSFQQLLAVDAGFHAAGLLTARVQLPEDQYADAPAQARYYQRVLENLRALPGVAAATYTSSLPFGGHLGTSGYSVEGIDGAGREPMEAQRQSVDEEYFTTMQIDILEGRGFSAGDSAQAPLVAVVDELFARRHWRDGSALGHRLRPGGAADDAPWVTIVGVAHSVRHRGLAEAPAKEAIYWPYRQHPAAAGMFVVKSTQSPATLAKSIRDAAAAVDASLATFDIKTIEERIQATLADRRTTMILLLAFAALSLLLASVGVYAVLAFVVGQRTGELGVRMAIGARPRDILRLVLGGGMRLIAIGAALGLVGAGAMAQLLRTQLFGISAGDPLTFVVVVAVIAVAALIACWLPARRAARVAPMVALRSE